MIDARWPKGAENARWPKGAAFDEIRAVLTRATTSRFQEVVALISPEHSAQWQFAEDLSTGRLEQANQDIYAGEREHGVMQYKINVLEAKIEDLTRSSR